MDYWGESPQFFFSLFLFGLFLSTTLCPFFPTPHPFMHFFSCHANSLLIGKAQQWQNDLLLLLLLLKSLQSCPTLCDPIDGSPPGSPIPGVLQARTLEWVVISFSKAWKWKVKMKSLSHVRLPATPWTAAHQTPPSMGYSRQENWSGVPLPSLIWGT